MHKRERLRLLTILLCALVLAGCGGESTPPAVSVQPTTAAAPAPTTDPALGEAETTGQVVLTIFSGRRDPSWALQPEELTTLLSTLSSLPAAEQGHEMPERLGYRGFNVQLVEESGLVWSLQSYDGLVRRDREGSVEFLSDPERRIERLLLQSGGEEVDPTLLQTVEDMLKQIPQP